MTAIRRTVLLPLLLALLLVGAGCAREWYRVREEESVRVETVLSVVSEPPGADVAVNGVGQGVTPLDIRLIYRYRKVVYAREKSYGVVRDTEERTLPEYFNNTFAITLAKPAYAAVEETVTLEGEETKALHVPLRPLER